MPKLKTKRGFTLIELLIVTILIGMLIGLGSFTYLNAQTRGRDTRRKQDLEAIKAALELYRQDNSNIYPSTLSGLPSSDIQTVPKDPKTAADYIYTPQPSSCTTNCNSYFLQTSLENSNDTGIAPSQANCPGAPSGSYYVVCPTK